MTAKGITRRRRRRVGLLGGTFNPVHLGHLLMAQDALEQIGLDGITFIPSAVPPHKPADPVVAAPHRRRMVELAVRGDPRFAVDDLELRRGGRSYTVDTLTELRRRRPGTKFYFIIGSDSLADLHRWKDLERLSGLCEFVVVVRPGSAPAGRPDRRLPGAVGRQIQRHRVEGHPCGISSSDLRSRLAHGRSIRYLVPESVRKYIERHDLYR